MKKLDTITAGGMTFTATSTPSLMRDSFGCLPAKADRPGEAELITVVAMHFGVPASVAVEWLADIDYTMARDALTEA